MNTLWLKIASAAIGILILIVIISMVMPGGDKEPATQQVSDDNNLPSNYWDQVKKDKQDLTVDNNYVDNSGDDSQTAIEPAQSNDNATPIPIDAQIVPVQPLSREMTIYVKKPNSAEQGEAETQLEFATKSFSIGRLPGTSYKSSVDAARRIIERWPDSIYSFHSKLLLAKVPERDQQQYKITSEELNTDRFLQPRAGTIPVKITIEDRS